MANEMLGRQIAAIHNLTFYNNLLKIAREKIIIGEFASWKNQIAKKLNSRI
jgi:queuine tRNA-ribosyltransferase